MTEAAIRQNKEKPKRGVWILNSNRWNSAITEYSLQLARALSSKYEVFYTAKIGTPAAARAAKMGLKVYPVDAFKVGELDKLRYIKERAKPYFVFTVGGQDTSMVSFLKKEKHETRIRFRGDHLKKGILRNILFKYSHKSFDGFLTPCELLANQLKPITTKKIKSIDLGIDSDAFSLNGYCQENQTTKKCLIFGRLDPVKGHREFLKIVASYKSKFPKTKLKVQIFGREENLSKNEIIDVASALGVEDMIEFQIGTIENVGTVMANAHAGVISSLDSELICRVAHEFLLSGTPVFVSGAGATEEVLKEKEFGASFKGLSDFEAADKLHELLSVDSSLEQKKELSNKAQKYFSLQSMSCEIELFLEDLSIFGV